MIPYILAAVGGYLIGDSLKRNQYADGGIIYEDEAMISKPFYYEEKSDFFKAKGYKIENKFYDNIHAEFPIFNIKGGTSVSKKDALKKANSFYDFVKSAKSKEEYDMLVDEFVSKNKKEYAVGGNVSGIYDRKIEFLKYILSNTSKFNSSIKDFRPEKQAEIKKSIKNANDFIKEDSSNKKKFNQVAPTLYKNLFIVNTPIWAKISRNYKEDSNYLMQEEQIMAGGGRTDNKYNYAVYFNRMVGGSRVPVVIDIFKNKEEAEIYSGRHRTYKFQEISKLATQSEVAISNEEKRKYLKDIVHSKEKVDEFFKNKDSFYKKSYSWVMPEGYKWDNWQIVANN